jgi:pimeloyl-ACP methyl ester carboxylesterase
VLLGLSFAGYLAPQAERRSTASRRSCANPAQPNMADHIPSGLVGKVAAPVVRAEMRLSDNKAEFFGARMAAHGISEIDAYFAELRRFDMTDDAGKITCPTLILECEGDFAGGGGTALEEVMTAPTTLVNLYDWVATVLAAVNAAEVETPR